jgi:hypothetical protein
MHIGTINTCPSTYKASNTALQYEIYRALFGSTRPLRYQVAVCGLYDDFHTEKRINFRLL